MLSVFGRRMRHVLFGHIWALKGFKDFQGHCAWVWHCQYCPRSHIRAPLDDPYNVVGYVPFYSQWEALRDNQVGAESGGRGVYLIQGNRMSKKAV